MAVARYSNHVLMPLLLDDDLILQCALQKFFETLTDSQNSTESELKEVANIQSTFSEPLTKVGPAAGTCSNSLLSFGNPVSYEAYCQVQDNPHTLQPFKDLPYALFGAILVDNSGLLLPTIEIIHGILDKFLEENE